MQNILQKWENLSPAECTARDDKEHFSNGRKMIPDRKLDVHKGTKNAESGKYVDKYKIVLFPPLYF